MLQITIWQNSPKGHNCLSKSRLSLAQTRCHDDLYQISAHTKNTIYEETMIFMYVVSNTRNPMLNTANPRMKKGYENTLTALQSSGKPTTVKVTLKLNVYEFIFPEKVSAKIFCDVMRKRTLIVFLSDRAITSFCRNPLWKIGDIRCKWITTQEIKCCSNALHFCSSSLNYHFFFQK